MARLVAVRVLAHKPRRIEREAHSLHLLRLGEQPVQLFEEVLRPAHRRNQPAWIMHDMPRVLPRIPLREILRPLAASADVELERAERLAPAAFGIATAGEADSAVEDVRPVAGAPSEECRIILLPKRLGEPGGAPVVIRMFQRAGNGLRPDDVKRIVAVFLPCVREVETPPRRIFRQGLADRGERLFRVEPPEALQVGVHYHRDRMVAYHALVVLAPQSPDRQESRRPRMFQHRADEVVDALRRENRVERMRGAERVPERQGRIVVPASSLRHLSVRSAIGTVHIRYVGRLQEEMVERRVPVRAHVRRAADELGAPQHLVPCLRGGGARAIEIPAAYLRREVAGRRIWRHGGKRHLHHERSARWKIEGGNRARPLLRGETPWHLDDVRNVVVELRRERIFPIHPYLRTQATGEGPRPVPFHVAFEDPPFRIPRVPVENAVLEIGEEARLGVAEIPDAVDRGVVRDRHLHARMAVVERHGVVSWFRLLGLFAVAAGEVRARQVEIARERHDEQVSQVAAPSAGYVCLRETENTLVGIAVAAAVVPPGVAGVRTGLDEPERICRRRIAVAVVCASDERIYVRCDTFSVRDKTRRRQRRQKHETNLHLNFHPFLAIIAIEVL